MRHQLPVRRQNTTHVRHDTPTYRPSHPPTNQYNSKRMHCFVLELRQSRPVIWRRQQNTAVVPKAITTPPPTGTNALTHARNDHHPPTQPTDRQPTNPSYHQTLQPICATAVQQQYSSNCTTVRTSWYVYQQTEAFGPYSTFYRENTIRMGTLHLQRSTLTCLTPVLTHAPTHNPPTNRYRYLLLHAEDTRTCDDNAHDQTKHPR